MSKPFVVKSRFEPAGDQPTAITSLVDGLEAGLAHQTLLGVTGSGKTFTAAHVIAELQRPTLVMAHNKTQIRELLTNYGPIDIIFFDGVAEGLKQLAWELQPDILVTRGDMGTPEQNIPGQPLPSPWEANFTLGTQWNYKPTNEEYKSGTRLIEMLIETRAKGGNLLLNVGHHLIASKLLLLTSSGYTPTL